MVMDIIMVILYINEGMSDGDNMITIPSHLSNEQIIAVVGRSGARLDQIAFLTKNKRGVRCVAISYIYWYLYQVFTTLSTCID